MRLCIAKAPSGVRAFRFSRIYQIHLRRSKDMIAICIACGLLICLFRLDLDDAASQG